MILRKKNGDIGNDGSMMFGIATTHHNAQSVKGATEKRFYEAFDDSRAAVMQRQIWVPFHFLPGGEGDTLEKKMVCTIDSKIAQEMIEHHINIALNKKSYGLHSLGVAAHVYMDTFAHYGFVGEGSKMNAIDSDSFDFEPCKKPESDDYLKNEWFKFADKVGGGKVFNFFASTFAATISDDLGHGAVGTYPDRPYLSWSFDFVENRPGNGKKSKRNNQKTYFDGCKRLYEYFEMFCKKHYTQNHDGKSFAQIEDVIKEILAFEHGKEERGQKWADSIKDGKFCTPDEQDMQIAYTPTLWENEREKLSELDSNDIIDTNIYKFHQAAALHRWFIFKDLLPKHGICVL